MMLGYILSLFFKILLIIVFLLTSPRRRKVCIVILKCFVRKGKRNHLWNKHLSTCSSVDLSNFKLVNNQLRSLTRRLRKDYEKKLVHDVKTRTKAF